MKKKYFLYGGIGLAVIVLGVVIMSLSNPDRKVKIVDSEIKNIVLEDYSTNEFKIKKPKGWKVDVLGDYIHYTIKVYNPENSLYQFFFNMKTEGYNKSEEAKKWQQKYYPNNIFAKTSVIEDKTTEGFYKIFNDLGTLNNTSTFTFPVLNEFNVVDNLGKAVIGGGGWGVEQVEIS